MPGKQLSAQERSYLIWVCRRLAAALQGAEGANVHLTVVSALEELARTAPEGPGRILSAMRDSLAGGKWAADALFALGMPTYVSGALKAGEVSSRLAKAATALAERLELEGGIPGGRERELLAYSLAFGRLGLLLGLRVPILAAMEAAAGSVLGSKAEALLSRAAEEVRQGADLGDALERSGVALPELTLQMIRDGEEDSRLPDALSVVSDYLLDEAGATSRARKGS
jgi:type II secretory pathway component PulF